MPKPIAVLISDIHFSIPNLPSATAALVAAKTAAEAADVPLVIAGDLNDTKAIIRGEVANTIIGILKVSKVKVYALVGNHDLLNEKGSEHGLNYLRPYAKVIDATMSAFEIAPKVVFMPYQNTTEKVRENLALIQPGSLIIMHQGVLGAAMGDYASDKSSIDPEMLKSFQCFSGHYHRHQTCGTLTYIGSPYTMTFTEANDGDKGFLILNDDFSYTRQILGLRKHVIVERFCADILNPIVGLKPCDKLWLKVSGPYSELQKLKKKTIGARHLGHCDFKLDLIYTDQDKLKSDTSRFTEAELMDQLIDGTDEAALQKGHLKQLWRSII